MRDALHVISILLLMGASVVVAHQLRRGRPAQLAIEILAIAAILVGSFATLGGRLGART